MTLQEIAARIDAHLKRFERDPKTNPLNEQYQTRPFCGATAYVAPRARKVSVLYVTYQGWETIRRDVAERYLTWLDAGNVGEHWQVPEGWAP